MAGGVGESAEGWREQEVVQWEAEVREAVRGMVGEEAVLASPSSSLILPSLLRALSLPLEPDPCLCCVCAC